MTLLGKVLVLVNAALALVMLIWALALWFSQVPTPFAPQQAGAKTAAAQPSDEPSLRLKDETEKRVALIKELNKALEDQTAKWRQVSAELNSLEASYYHHQVFYEQQLDEAENGKPVNPAPGQIVHRGDKVRRDLNAKVQDLVWKDGRLQYNTERGNLLYGLPLMADARDIAGNAIHPLPYYPPEIKQFWDRADKVSDQAQKASTEARDQTALLSGDLKNGVKGLRTRLADELDKQRRIADEDEELGDVLTKNELDVRLMNRRKEQMEDRVKELKGVLNTSTR